MIKTIVAISAIVLFSSCHERQEKTIPQETSQPQATLMNAPDFDGARAFSYLKAQTDFGPRNPNSEGHRKCLAYLDGELTKYADKVTRQNFIQEGYGGEVLKLTNLFGSFNSAATDRILLLAHWDTRPRSDQEKDPAQQNKPILGANDGASGVSILLELARLLKQLPPQTVASVNGADGPWDSWK